MFINSESRYYFTNFCIVKPTKIGHQHVIVSTRKIRYQRYLYRCSRRCQILLYFANLQLLNTTFHRCLIFSNIFHSNKNMPHCSIYCVQFGYYARYLKNLLQTQTTGPKLSNFDKKMYNRGRRLPLSLYFFLKIGKFQVTTDSFEISSI